MGAGKGVVCYQRGASVKAWGRPGPEGASWDRLFQFEERTGSGKASARQQGEPVKTALLAPWRRVCAQKREQMARAKVWGELAACLHVSSWERVKDLRGHVFRKGSQHWGSGHILGRKLLSDILRHSENNSYHWLSASSVPDTLYQKTPLQSPCDVATIFIPILQLKNMKL